METFKFVTGRVEITRPTKITNPQDEAEELMKAVQDNRELMTLAIDTLLKSKGYHVAKVIHDQNGRIFADVFTEKLPAYKSKGAVKEKPMASGWTRGFVGFTRTLRDTLHSHRSKGRKQITFEELYREVMDVFKDRQGKKYRAMDRDKFAGYLHDKRYFPTIKYNSVEKLVRF